MRAWVMVAMVMLLPAMAAAQDDMEGMDMSGHDMAGMQDHDSTSADHAAMAMTGALGGYTMNREASGSSWVPDSSPMEGWHVSSGDWTGMVHGYVDGVYNDQGGKRGDSQAYSDSMLMMMAQRPAGENGTFGVRTMLSLDPLMGKEGYPLLLQSGETADGVNHLVDRQHPHDLFMELAGTYSYRFDEDNSAFVYVGYPGEPALGPPTFMHRFSGQYIPEAPIDHHWLDSTHITFGVTTLGYVWHNWKAEASAFNGREPDQFRYNFDHFQLDSYAGRLSWNPTENWALQVSRGEVHSPEQLDPLMDVTRTTASAIYNLPLGDDNWQTTFAWGRNDNSPGETLDAWLLESAYQIDGTHTFFTRAERAEKDELFEAPDPLAGQSFNVNKLSLGYLYQVPTTSHVKLGVGGLVSAYALPNELDDAYGRNPVSFLLFARASLY
jgi:hypothetical protein